MAKSRIAIQAFVSSPSDAEEEREALEEIVRDLNITWSDSLGVNIELLKWETHVRPAISAEPQAVINEQIGDEYDIFIGIMRTRFGSPTHRFGSGTEEEFNRALARYRINSASLSIMFYFKSGKIDLETIDVEQLQKVRLFKAGLGSEGALYRTYGDLDQFKQMLRSHLAMELQKWKPKELPNSPARRIATSPEQETAASQPDSRTGDDDAGFLELVVEGVAHFERFTESAKRMIQTIQTLNFRSVERTSEIEGLMPSSGRVNIAKAIAVTNAYADDISDFVRRMDAETPLFSDAYRKGIDCYGRAASYLGDFGINEEVRSQAESAATNVDELSTIIRETFHGVSSMRNGIEKIPRVTSGVTKARRNALRVIDNLLAETSKFLAINEEAKKLMKAVVDRQGA